MISKHVMFYMNDFDIVYLYFNREKSVKFFWSIRIMMIQAELAACNDYST